MTWVIPPLVTEHEPGTDYNCVPCSGLMQKLANAPGSAPATLAEAKAIRAASGIPMTGPMSSLNLIVGERNRYHWQPAEIPRGFASIWASLTPGHSATASGIPTDAPVGSPFRHWLPNYSGGHRVYVARMDSLDRVWLLDPEAPDGYSGEWASKSDLARFVQNGSTHTVAPIAETHMSFMDSINLPDPNPRTYHIAANKTIQIYDPATPGAPVGSITAGPTGKPGTCVARASITSNVIPKGSGFLRLDWTTTRVIVAAEVFLDPDAPPPPSPGATVLTPGVYEVIP